MNHSSSLALLLLITVSTTAPADEFVPLPRIPSPWIVGGDPAPADAYPWMVSLNYIGEPDLFDGYFCGATLIHPSWVLTAAHCVAHLSPDQLDVVYGIDDLSASSGYERIGVAEIITHPDYNASNYDADIALLRLTHPVAEGHAVTLPLADTAMLETPGTSGRVLGWGYVHSTGGALPQLQQVDLPIVPFATANAAWNGQLTTNMLAAGGTGTGVCFGDSGGPMMVSDPDLDRWMLTGVVSFGGLLCATPGSYGIYSRVLPFRQFVLEHISPGFLGWEQALGVTGRLRDPDQDERDNASEFLVVSDPLAPDFPSNVAPAIIDYMADDYGAVSWSLPEFRPELAVDVEFSTLLDGSWQSLDLDTHLTGSSTAGDVETLTIRAPDALNVPPRRGFFRPAATYSDVYAPATRSFAIQTQTEGTLTTEDPEHPGFAAVHYHLYRWIPGAESGQLVRLFARSGEFDMRFELLDESGTLIESSTDDDAVGLLSGDEEIAFTPVAATTYLLRVSTETAGATGRYSLGGLISADFDGIPVIAPGFSDSITLSAASPPDPLRQPGPVYRSMDYRVSAATDGWMETAMLSTVVDPRIHIIDAETGKGSGWLDDHEDSAGRINPAFRLTAGHNYLVRFTTAGDSQTGSASIAANPASANSVSPGSSPSFTLTSLDRVNPAPPYYSPGDPFPEHYKDEILITSLTPGTQVTVTVTSPNTNVLDPYIYRLDPVSGEIIEENDDLDPDNFDYNSRIVFTAREPVSIFRVSSAYPEETGSYTVSVTSP